MIGREGLVYFQGRSDTQIKSRGHRIELGEIETALSVIDELAESAVVALPTDGFEGYSICCAYVPAAGADVSPVTLRTALRTHDSELYAAVEVARPGSAAQERQRQDGQAGASRSFR